MSAVFGTEIRMLAGQVALAVASAALVLATDQATKAAVQRLSLEHSAQLAAVQIKVVRNPHGGIGRFAVPRPMAITSGLMVTAIALAAIAVIGPLPAVTVVGLGVAMGGTAGNVADLLLRGYVVDFVSIGRWPVFNLADVALCVGVCLTVLGLW
jgi:signal peptidase II